MGSQRTIRVLAVIARWPQSTRVVVGALSDSRATRQSQRTRLTDQQRPVPAVLRSVATSSR